MKNPLFICSISKMKKATLLVWINPKAINGGRILVRRYSVMRATKKQISLGDFVVFVVVVVVGN